MYTKSLAVFLAQSKSSTTVSAPSIWKLTNSINQNHPSSSRCPAHFPKLPVRRIINLVSEKELHKSPGTAPGSRALSVSGSVCSADFCWLSLPHPYCKQKNSHQHSQKKGIMLSVDSTKGLILAGQEDWGWECTHI